MIQIEKIRIDVTKDIKVVDMQVSTTAELPDKGENVGGIIIAPGSIAQVIQTGAWYTLDDNGTWYDSDGTAASSASSLNASLSAPKTSAQLGEGKSVLVQDEPEINLDGGGFESEIEPTVKEQKKEYVESIEEPEKNKDGEDDDELL